MHNVSETTCDKSDPHLRPGPIIWRFFIRCRIMYKILCAHETPRVWKLLSQNELGNFPILSPKERNLSNSEVITGSWSRKKGNKHLKK